MSLKKTVAIAVAAGALAAISVPAMALDNEFHGMYRLRGIMSNFENAATGTLTTSPKDRTTTVFEQRARLQYTAKASDDLKLVTHFEIDSSWGDTGGATGGRGLGGGVGADSVNLETKNVYLDFKIPSTPINAKVGIQGFADAYKGIFLLDDIAAAVFTAKMNAATVTAGFSRLMDNGGYLAASTNPTGQKTADLYLLDGKFAVAKDTTIGGSYYLLRNDYNYRTSDIHMIGLNAAAKLGPAALDAFFVLQAGEIGTLAAKQKLTAWAAQVGAKVDVGPGALRTQFLYASGDDLKNTSKAKAFQSVNGFVGQSSSFYTAKMLILMRTALAMDSDKAIIGSTNNANQGLMFLNLGYDAKFGDKLGATFNVGLAGVDKRNTVTASDSKFVGTELNAGVDYKLYSNLTAAFDAGYVILGDYYKQAAGAPKLQNPFLTQVMLNFTF